MTLYEKYFRQVIQESTEEEDDEELVTQRSGPDGVEVSVPAGFSTMTGSDGRLVSFNPSSSVREDGTGRIIEIKPHHRYFEGKNGKGISVPIGASVVETDDGGLKIIKRRLTALETIQYTTQMALLAENLRRGISC